MLALKSGSKLPGVSAITIFLKPVSPRCEGKPRPVSVMRALLIRSAVGSFDGAVSCRAQRVVKPDRELLPRAATMVADKNIEIPCFSRGPELIYEGRGKTSVGAATQHRSSVGPPLRRSRCREQGIRNR